MKRLIIFTLAWTLLAAQMLLSAHAASRSGSNLPATSVENGSAENGTTSPTDLLQGEAFA